MALRNGLLLAWLMFLSACSLDNLQRLSYFAVQNIGQMQCQKRFADDCHASKSFDAYQRERQDIQQ